MIIVTDCVFLNKTGTTRHTMPGHIHTQFRIMLKSNKFIIYFDIV